MNNPHLYKMGVPQCFKRNAYISPILTFLSNKVLAKMWREIKISLLCVLRILSLADLVCAFNMTKTWNQL